MKNYDYIGLSVNKTTYKRFNKLKKYNGWTADFFLSRLLDFWEFNRDLKESNARELSYKEVMDEDLNLLQKVVRR